MLTKLWLASSPKGLRISHPKGVEMYSLQEAHRQENKPSNPDLKAAEGICRGVIIGSLLWLLAILGLFWML